MEESSKKRGISHGGGGAVPGKAVEIIEVEDSSDEEAGRGSSRRRSSLSSSSTAVKATAIKQLRGMCPPALLPVFQPGPAARTSSASSSRKTTAPAPSPASASGAAAKCTADKRLRKGEVAKGREEDISASDSEIEFMEVVEPRSPLKALPLNHAVARTRGGGGKEGPSGGQAQRAHAKWTKGKMPRPSDKVSVNENEEEDVGSSSDSESEFEEDESDDSSSDTESEFEDLEESKSNKRKRSAQPRPAHLRQMPWQILGRQAWPPTHAHADLFTRLDALALELKEGPERDAATRNLLSKLPKAVSKDYLTRKVHDQNFGFQVYRGALQHVDGAELEATAESLDDESLWYQKGDDKHFFTAQGGKVAKTEEERLKVAESPLMAPATAFFSGILPVGVTEHDKYVKLSEASTRQAIHGIQDEHGDGHSADGRGGVRVSQAGGGADCGTMTCVLPESACGHKDVAITVRFQHGDGYWLPNAIGHRRFSLIKHKVEQNTTGAIVFASLHDYRVGTSSAARDALVPTVLASQFRPSAPAAAARDPASFLFREVSNRGLRDQNQGQFLRRSAGGRAAGAAKKGKKEKKSAKKKAAANSEEGKKDRAKGGHKGGQWEREGAERQGLGKGTAHTHLLLECERKDGGPKCRWQVQNIRDKPSQPCQDKCRLKPDQVCRIHERQVQNVKRLHTCDHAKATNKRRDLYNGKVADRSTPPFPAVPYANGTFPA